MVSELPAKQFDVFLSHSHSDAEWVEALASRLVDERQIKVWLDRWSLIPGKHWQQEMAKGLNEASTCAVFINSDTPQGWFSEEIQKAQDLQTREPGFRVIPVLLPGAEPKLDLTFLGLRTWSDFRLDKDADYAFHVLVQGIRGNPIGRWPTKGQLPSQLIDPERKLMELRHLAELGLREEVVIEFQKRILDRWFGD